MSYLKRYEPSKDFPFTPPPKIREGGDEQQDKDIPPPNTEPSAKAKLFLSYRHANSEEARKVKAFLEANGIEVLIDFERLKPGGNIRQFIIDMINESDATISLVSAKSLASAWVGEESDLTMMSELFRGQTRFIACALDTEFFKPGFTNDVLRQIVSEINRLDQEKTERKEISPLLGTSDLDSEIARYKDYMSNLDKIINRLKEFLTIDISGDNFEAGLRQVIDSFD
ncbi:MAG: toll/interleukin-1 receptor domain-containing protein [Bacteroidota bacterium]